MYIPYKYYRALCLSVYYGINNGSVVCIGLQENPSEEDAAVVDKIMASRLVKKEVTVFYNSTWVSVTFHIAN